MEKVPSISVSIATLKRMALGVQIAQYKEYTVPLVEHLAMDKVEHWDVKIRQLTSQALYNLTPKAQDYMIQEALPYFVANCADSDLNKRHGCVLAAAHVTNALAGLARQEDRKVEHLLPTSLVASLVGIIAKLEERLYFRGLGGELMKQAACTLIEKLSESEMELADETVDQWQQLIHKSLHYVEMHVKLAAASAIPAFFYQYYRGTDKQEIRQKQGETIDSYIEEVHKAATETARLGFCLALGAFPKELLEGRLSSVLECLMAAAVIHGEEDVGWAEARTAAVKAIGCVCSCVGVEEKAGAAEDQLCTDNIQQVFDCLFRCMQDYTVDSRGDVGRNVREATMTTLKALTLLCLKSAPELLTENIVHTLLCRLVQQSTEKIDRTRHHAAKIFLQLIQHKNPPLPHVRESAALHALFPRNVTDSINWRSDSDWFDLVVPALQLPAYRHYVLLGLCISVGGLSESVVSKSSVPFVRYLNKIGKDLQAVCDFTSELISIYQSHSKDERVIFCLFKTTNQILENGIFDILIENSRVDLISRLVEHMRAEVKNSSSVPKLLASAEVFCSLIQFPEIVRNQALFQIALFLGHRYPRLRSVTADKLFESLVTYDNVVDEEEKLDEIMSLLGEMQWKAPLTEVKPVRDKLCTLFQIDIPKRIVKKNVSE